MRVSAHRTKIFFREDRKIYRNYYFCKKKRKKRERTSKLPRKTTKTFSKYRRISFLRNRNVLSNKRITDSLIRKKRKKREKKKENVKKKKGEGGKEKEI